MNQESNTHPTIETHLAEISSKEFLSLWVAAQAILLHRDFSVSARIIFNEACKMTGATSGYVALLSTTGEENEVLFF